MAIVTQTPPNGHTLMSSYDWDTGAHTYNAPAMDPAQIWRTAVALAATKARQALPACSTRIDKAIELVLNQAVELLDGGQARVTSQHNGQSTYLVCNGTCDCADFPRAFEGWCKHRLARALTVRAIAIARTLGQAEHPVTVTPAALPDDLEQTAPDLLTVHDLQAERTPASPVTTGPWSSAVIPAEFVITIQGKKFILFSGLLFLAHQQGLLSLTEEVTHVTDTYVMASARAEFHDGRVFRGVGDSTPDNVGKQVKPHWRRLAGTRAMARCLRNALNIPLVALEELD